MTETISRRDYFAVHILQGLLANSRLDASNLENRWEEIAVTQADDLIRYLDAVKVAEEYNHHTAWAFGGSENQEL
jgi:hypothetical protein